MKWLKPNGNEIELNDDPANIKAAESLGLKRIEEPKEEPKKVKVDSGPKKIKLYKRLDGEIVEGQEPPEEVIIQSDSFVEKEARKKIKEGWFATEEEAAHAPPDKVDPKDAGSGAVTTKTPK